MCVGGGSFYDEKNPKSSVVKWNSLRTFDQPRIALCKTITILYRHKEKAKSTKTITSPKEGPRGYNHASTLGGEKNIRVLLPLYAILPFLFGNTVFRKQPFFLVYLPGWSLWYSVYRLCFFSSLRFATSRLQSDVCVYVCVNVCVCVFVCACVCVCFRNNRFRSLLFILYFARCVGCF